MLPALAVALPCLSWAAAASASDRSVLCPANVSERFYGLCNPAIVETLTGVKAGDTVAVLTDDETAGSANPIAFFVGMFSKIVGRHGRVYTIHPDGDRHSQSVPNTPMRSGISALPFADLNTLPPLAAIWAVSLSSGGLSDFQPLEAPAFQAIVRSLQPGGVFIVEDADRQISCSVPKPGCPAHGVFALHGTSHECVLQAIEMAGLDLREELTRLYDPVHAMPFGPPVSSLPGETISWSPFLWVFDRPVATPDHRADRLCVPLPPMDR